MPVNPNNLKRFVSDGQVHEVVKAKSDDPPLTMAGYYRVTCKCALTCDCSPVDLEDALRFSTSNNPAVTCLGCLAAP